MRAEDRFTAAAGARGRLRASDSDRERVVDMLKTAYVHGRLTKDELDMRLGQTLASRTWGDLTALTADIPAWQIPRPAAKPATTPASPVHAIVKALACALIAMAAVALAGMPGVWTMPAPPSMTARACQIFHAWQNPATRSVASLSDATAMASNGYNPRLGADLAALQQAYRQYEDVGGYPQSAAARHFAASQVRADTARVSADCLAGG